MAIQIWFNIAITGVYTKFSGWLSEEQFSWLIQKFPCMFLSKTGQPGRQLNLFEGQIRLDLTSRRPLVSGLEGFGRYPVFTVVFTGKYRPGKNRFWTLKAGKTGKNTTSLLKQFHISIIRLNMTFKCIIQDIRFLSMDNYVQLNIVLQCIIIYCLQFLYII